MKGFKTFGFGTLLIVLGGIESSGFTDFIAQNAGAYSGLVGVAVVVLRALTTTSMFKDK